MKESIKFFLCTIIIFLSFSPISTSTAFRIIPGKEIRTALNLGESKNFIIEIIADPNKPSDIGETFVFTLERSAFPDTYSIVPSRSIIPYCKISYDKKAKLQKGKPVIAELSISFPSNTAKRGSFFGDLLVTPANAQALIHRKTVHLFVTVIGNVPPAEQQEIKSEINVGKDTQVVTANLKNTGDLSFATEGGEAIIRNPLSGEAIQTIVLIPEGAMSMKTIFPENSKLFTGKIEAPLLGGNYKAEIQIPVVYPAIEEGEISKTVPATTTTTACISKKISEKIWGKLPHIEITPSEIKPLPFFVGKSLRKKLTVKNNSTQKLKIRAEYPDGRWVKVHPAEFTLIGNQEIYLDFENPNREELKGEVIITAYNESGEAAGEPVVLELEIYGK
ncbi:MAG: hypothetical protein V1770_06725 [bacterium]